jgi:hypothetical protein
MDKGQTTQWPKDRQHIGQREKDKMTNNDILTQVHRKNQQFLLSTSGTVLLLLLTNTNIICYINCVEHQYK